MKYCYSSRFFSHGNLLHYLQIYQSLDSMKSPKSKSKFEIWTIKIIEIRIGLFPNKFTIKQWIESTEIQLDFENFVEFDPGSTNWLLTTRPFDFISINNFSSLQSLVQWTLGGKHSDNQNIYRKSRKYQTYEIKRWSSWYNSVNCIRRYWNCVVLERFKTFPFDLVFISSF